MASGLGPTPHSMVDLSVKAGSVDANVSHMAHC